MCVSVFCLLPRSLILSTNEALCDGPVDPAAWDAIMEKIVAEGFGHEDVRFAACVVPVNTAVVRQEVHGQVPSEIYPVVG